MKTTHIEADQNTTIGEIVAADFRTAAVFSEYGIDFCCKGDRTLEQVCTKKGIAEEELLAKLEQVYRIENNNTIDFKSWPPDLLADYIEKKHHRYVAAKTPILLEFLHKLSKVHGARHPELINIYKIFSDSAIDLAAHMKKEEEILFPFIRNLVNARNATAITTSDRFDRIENPIAMMKEEHVVEGDRFAAISALSSNYSIPDDACSTYKVTYAMLAEFEKDLHAHIHLENNILFPAAIALQASLLLAVHQ